MKLKFNTYGCNYETYLHVIITHVCKPSKRWLPQSRSILSEREYLTIQVFKERRNYSNVTVHTNLFYLVRSHDL